MNDLVWERQPEVRQRVLVAAFAGYFDAASASTGAIDWLVEHSGATRLAHIEPDDFFDFQQLRPQVVLEDGVTRQIVWPENIVHVTEHLGPDRDLVMLSGIEPHVHWRQFCSVLLDVADRASCEMVVTLGATPAQVPHTRMPPVFGSSTNTALAARLGLSRPQYEGITGLAECCTWSSTAPASPRSRCVWASRTTRPERTTRRRRWRCSATSNT